MTTYETWQPYETARTDCTVQVKRHWGASNGNGSSWRAIHVSTRCSVFLSVDGSVADADALTELFSLLDHSVAQSAARNRGETPASNDDDDDASDTSAVGR